MIHIPTTRKLLVFCLVVILASIFMGCQTTKEDIDKWSGAMNGDEKIIHAMKDPRVEPAIRSYAVVSLIKSKQVELMFKALQSMPKDQQALLIRESAGGIGELFKNPDMNIQASAKDALFQFMKVGDESIRKASKNVILNWYGTNFDKKYGAGVYSGFVVLTAIGQEVTPLLHKLIINPKLKAVRPKIVKIIEKINDPELARLTSDYFIEELNKQAPNFSEDLLHLLHFVRDDRVTELLNNFVAKYDNPEAMREAVLDTLRFKPNKLSLPAALRIFINKKESMDMRGMAIEIIQETGDEASLKFLYNFLKDENVKWAVFGAILKIGKDKVVKKTFSKLNPRAKFWRGDYDVARRHLKKLPPEAAEQLAPYLKSKHVPLVVLALIGIQYTATPKQAEEWLKGMLDDKRIIKNYHSKNQISVGLLAKEILDRVSSGSDKKKEARTTPKVKETKKAAEGKAALEK